MGTNKIQFFLYLAKTHGTEKGQYIEASTLNRLDSTTDGMASEDDFFANIMRDLNQENFFYQNNKIIQSYPPLF